MGQDKALLTVGGTAMAVAVANALERAGASSVVCVGGDLERLRALGLAAAADEREGTGPLGGLVSALELAGESLALVTPCDLVEPDAAAFAALVSALRADPGLDIAVPVADGVWRPLPCAVRTATVTPAVRDAFDRGERAVHRALQALTRVEVAVGALRDADTPEDLPGRR